MPANADTRDASVSSCAYRAVDTMPTFWEFWSRAEKTDRPTQLRLLKEIVVARYPNVYTPSVIGMRPGRTLEEGSASAGTTSSRKSCPDFFFGNATRSDVPRRSGYYIGLLVAEEIAKHRSWSELIRLRGDTLRTAVDDALAKIATSNAH